MSELKEAFLSVTARGSDSGLLRLSSGALLAIRARLNKPTWPWSALQVECIAGALAVLSLEGLFWCATFFKKAYLGLLSGKKFSETRLQGSGPGFEECLGGLI